jgi:multiple sugar transport system permease protein
MDLQERAIDNRKYAREKRRKDAFAAWVFLLPNFLGFLLITFFPVFFTFFLSFTEWDGLTWASPAELSVVLATRDGSPARQTVTLPEGTPLTVTTTQRDRRQVGINVPYRINQDIVIGAEETIHSFIPINALREWSFYKTPADTPIVEPVVDMVEEDLRQNIAEGQLFFSRDNLTAINPRFEKGVEGVALEASEATADISIVKRVTEEDVVIPAGTVFFVDLFINIVTGVETVEWTFILDRPLVLQAGETETRVPVNVKAEQSGAIAAEPVLRRMTLETPERIPNVAVRPKFIRRTGTSGIKMVGFKNYRNLFVTDSRFRFYMYNTLIFLLQIPFGMALSLIMALAMNQPLKGIVVFRVLFFIPVISNIVAVALLWRWIFNADYGLINTVLRGIGVMNPPRWFSNPGWARVTIIIAEVWKGAGYNMMLYLAGLQGIPHYLYEAAEIDGASGFQKFWNITWPLLGPTNFFIIIMGVIGGFQAFGTQYVMTAGGPAGSTTTIVYYLYNHAYQWNNMGYATAIAVVLFAFVMIITIINWNLTEGKVEY